MSLFHCKSKGQNWTKFLGDSSLQSKKQRLIEECKRRDVSIYLDDSGEISSGVYAELRGVASESELEHRLIAKIAAEESSRANWIAGLAFLVSLISLAVSLYKPTL